MDGGRDAHLGQGQKYGGCPPHVCALSGIAGLFHGHPRSYH